MHLQSFSQPTDLTRKEKKIEVRADLLQSGFKCFDIFILPKKRIVYAKVFYGVDEGRQFSN